MVVSTKQFTGSFAEEIERELPRFLLLAKEKKVEFLDFDFIDESLGLDTF